MKINKIVSNMGKLNLKIRWCVLYAIMYLLSGVGFELLQIRSSYSDIVELSDNKSITLEMLMYRLMILVTILACNAFFDKYTIPSKDYLIENHKKLYDYVGYHPFPRAKYFFNILMRFLLLNILFIIANGIVAYRNNSKNEIVPLVIVFFVPFVVWFVRYQIFEFEIAKGNKYNWYKKLDKYVNIGMRIMYALFITVPILVLGMGVAVFVKSLKSVIDYDKGPCIVFVQEIQMLELVFVFLLALSMMLMFFKKKRIYMIILVVNIVILIGYGSYVTIFSKPDYVKITGEHLTIMEDGEKKSYTFEDIKKCNTEKYYVYDRNIGRMKQHGYICRITFNDGNKIRLRDSGSHEMNDEWSEMFKDVVEYLFWLEESVNK